MEREEAEKSKEASFDQLRRMTPKEFHNIFKHLRRLNYYKRPGMMDESVPHWALPGV